MVEPDQQGSAIYQAHMAHKPKKSYTGLIFALAAVALIGVSGYLNRDWLTAKWKSLRGPSAAEIAAANQPPPTPPPPPEMTPVEIMQKVAEVYKAMPSFSSTGKSTAIIDMSAISPALAAAGPKTASSDLTLKMSKPLSFHIEMTTPTATSNVTLMGWSTGNGDFIQSNNRRVQMPSDEDLFSRFTSGSSIGVSVGVGEIIRLFMEGTKPGLDNPGIEWTRTKDENLNSQPCYVLAGMVKLQVVMVWVNRRSFLIPQTRVILVGAAGAAGIDDAKIKQELKAENNGKEPTLLQIDTVKKRLKAAGMVTDTYDNIQTNITLAMTDLVPPAPVPAMSAGAPGQGGAPPGRATGIANGAGGGRRGR